MDADSNVIEYYRENKANIKKKIEDDKFFFKQELQNSHNDCTSKDQEIERLEDNLKESYTIENTLKRKLRKQRGRS